MSPAATVEPLPRSGGVEPDAPEPTAAPTNADDLLAKLAGDEIDRLLADEEGVMKPPAGDSSASPAPTRQTQTPSTPQLPVPSGEASATEPAVTPIATPTSAPPEPAATDAATAADVTAESAVQSELNTLFAELTGKKDDTADATGKPPPTPATVSPSADVPVEPQVGSPVVESPVVESMGDAVTPVDPSADLSDVTESGAFESTVSGDGGVDPSVTALEAELRETMATAPTPAAAKPPDEPAPAPAATQPPLPVGGLVGLLLRPLEWINAPLEALGPGARETVGKIAIITAFNAVVVLAYVLFFRAG